MTKSLMEIADEARDDIICLQEGFEGLHAVFITICKLLPPDTAAYDLARLGIAEVAEWSTKAFDWEQRMCADLDAIDQGATQ